MQGKIPKNKSAGLSLPVQLLQGLTLDPKGQNLSS